MVVVPGDLMSSSDHHKQNTHICKIKQIPQWRCILGICGIPKPSFNTRSELFLRSFWTLLEQTEYYKPEQVTSPFSCAVDATLHPSTMGSWSWNRMHAFNKIVERWRDIWSWCRNRQSTAVTIWLDFGMDDEGDKEPVLLPPDTIILMKIKKAFKWHSAHKDVPPLPPGGVGNKEKQTSNIPIWDPEVMKVD